MKKVGIIFGGMSTENEVSVKSAEGILNNISRRNYHVYPIYISQKGIWYRYIERTLEKGIHINISHLQKIENITQYIKQLDIIIPVLHGLYGEDGTIQGLFEILQIPYVGCKVLASAIAMDKAYTKIIFEKAGLNQVKYMYIKNVGDSYIYVDEDLQETMCTLDIICKNAVNKLKFPIFVKPSNSGSSLGVSKACNIEGLKEAIKTAEKYDSKILIEQGIDGKEVECAVLEKENCEIISSCVGEVQAADEFYSYDAKYVMSESKTLIPANISKEIESEIQYQAIKAFKAIDGRGLARVDFFIENVTGQIYINEINTFPGFTQISMYPKLFEETGIKYTELIDILIQNASK